MPFAEGPPPDPNVVAHWWVRLNRGEWPPDMPWPRPEPDELEVVLPAVFAVVDAFANEELVRALWVQQEAWRWQSAAGVSDA